MINRNQRYGLGFTYMTQIGERNEYNLLALQASRRKTKTPRSNASNTGDNNK